MTMSRNRIMTRDEVVLEVGIPYLRAAIMAAQSRLKSNETTAAVPNVMRDCMPLTFERSALENGGATEILAKLDALDQRLRQRVKA